MCVRLSSNIRQNMSFSKMYSLPYLLLLFLYVPISIFQTKAQTLTAEDASSKSVPAIFIFGDSASDPGNNNFISTPLKSNFPPYGRDFVNKTPTGRFTNGRLANDYIAKYLGIKAYVPPYLNSSLSMEELMTGVSFASAGSGFDPLTPRISNVISMSTQLEYFKEYRSRLTAEMGKEKAENVIRKSFFLVGAGTNDFVVNYFTIPIRRRNYTIPAYIDFCLQHVQLFLQGLLDLGARRIGIGGLPPMGCLPLVITLYSSFKVSDRGCIRNFSEIAESYNQKLQIQLKSMQPKLAELGSRVGYLDTYGPLADMTAQPKKYDFKEVSSGCCGTGYLEASMLCNSRSYVCPDASKYVFWDSMHPTEKSYNILSQILEPTIDSIIYD